MKYLLLFILSIAFISCGKFSDGTSVWQEGLWIAPLLTGLGAAWFGVLTYLSWRKGGTEGYIYDEKGLPRWTQDDKRFPIYKASHFWFFAGLLLATIAIIWWVNAEK